MQLDYPRPLTGDRDQDIQDLWEALWHLIEALNVEEQRRAEDETNRTSTVDRLLMMAKEGAFDE